MIGGRGDVDLNIGSVFRMQGARPGNSGLFSCRLRSFGSMGHLTGPLVFFQACAYLHEG